MLEIFTDFHRMFAAASPLPAVAPRAHVHEKSRTDRDWDGTGNIWTVFICTCGAESTCRCKVCGERIWSDDPSPDVETCNPCHLQLMDNQAVDDDLAAIQAEVPHHDAPVELTEAQLERMRETEGAL